MCSRKPFPRTNGMWDCSAAHKQAVMQERALRTEVLLFVYFVHVHLCKTRTPERNPTGCPLSKSNAARECSTRDHSLYTTSRWCSYNSSSVATRGQIEAHLAVVDIRYNTTTTEQLQTSRSAVENQHRPVQQQWVCEGLLGCFYSRASLMVVN